MSSNGSTEGDKGMSQASPAPKSDLDATIEKIDACLPRIHEKAKETGRKGKTPSGAFRIGKNFKKTQQDFALMADDKILTDSGEDIKLRKDAPDIDAVTPTPLPRPTPSPGSQKRANGANGAR